MLLRKSLSLNNCDIKLDEDTGRFAGYASVFGGVDSYGDTIIKGAYEYTLKNNGKPKMFFNHDAYALPIGKWLTAKEDDHGLFVEGELTPGNAASEDVRAALKHGTVDGLSIGYRLKAADYEDLESGGRVIKRVSLLAEVSIVTFPADSSARVDLASVKSELDGMSTIKEFERFLRDAGGFSREAVKTILSRAKVLLNQRNADQLDEAKQEDLAATAVRLWSIRTPS
jgi:HK97 family phage prohead protease